MPTPDKELESVTITFKETGTQEHPCSGFDMNNNYFVLLDKDSYIEKMFHNTIIDNVEFTYVQKKDSKVSEGESSSSVSKLVRIRPTSGSSKNPAV